MFPANNGMSKSVSPRTIVTGRPGADYKDECRVEFEAYAQVHDENNPSNTTKSRTTGAIVLNHSGNDKGSVNFMLLSTGHVLHRRAWAELPISGDVIRAVEDRAKQEGFPIIDGAPKFKWEADVPIDDDDNNHRSNDPNYHQPAPMESDLLQ